MRCDTLGTPYLDADIPPGWPTPGDGQLAASHSSLESELLFSVSTHGGWRRGIGLRGQRDKEAETLMDGIIKDLRLIEFN